MANLLANSPLMNEIIEQACRAAMDEKMLAFPWSDLFGSRLTTNAVDPSSTVRSAVPLPMCPSPYMGIDSVKLVGPTQSLAVETENVVSYRFSDETFIFNGEKTVKLEPDLTIVVPSSGLQFSCQNLSDETLFISIGERTIAVGAGETWVGDGG